MRIRVMSDLHLEYNADLPPAVYNEDPPDVYVLAGDIFPLAEMDIDDRVEAIRTLVIRAPVVMIKGNHELYGSDARNAGALLDALRNKVDDDDFHLLDRSSVELGGKRFHGATMYWPEPANPNLVRFMRDYKVVTNLTPWVYDEARLDAAFLETHVDAGDVVVTHLLPSMRCVVPRYRNLATNHFFVREMDDLIRRQKPALWIHGHTHEGVDVAIGRTRIVCNPFGYPGERQDTPFDPGFEVEI